MSERPPISPRSPRAALEPEQVPPPPKRSERARNPFIVVGNAIITFILFVMIAVGGTYIYGKQKIEAPGPLQEDKVVNIPPRSGIRDIADLLVKEGVIEHYLTFVVGSFLSASQAAPCSVIVLVPGSYV